MQLSKKIFEITKSFPQSEQYEMRSQMRSAAVSVPSNIAEGSQRTTDKDFANFILIARGSLAELQTQLLLSEDFGYVSKAVVLELEKDIEEISKMLHSFHSKLTA